MIKMSEPSFLLQLEHFPPKLQKYVKIFVLVLKRCEFILLIYSLLWKQNSGYTVTVYLLSVFMIFMIQVIILYFVKNCKAIKNTNVRPHSGFTCFLFLIYSIFMEQSFLYQGKTFPYEHFLVINTNLPFSTQRNSKKMYQK